MPGNMLGHCKAYTDEEFLNLRKGGYWASHIRTFKYKLYKELVRQDPDLLCYKDIDGNFYTITYDVAIMTPLMEIAGFDRVKFNPNPVYFYRLHEQNDHVPWYKSIYECLLLWCFLSVYLDRQGQWVSHADGVGYLDEDF